MLKKNIRIKPKPNKLKILTTPLSLNPSVFGVDLKALGITSPQTQYVTRQIAAQVLGQKTQTLAVWSCYRRHDLPVYKIGRKPMYLVADLLQFLEASKQ